MLHILDTDHVSLLQRGNIPVRANLEQISIDQRAVTIITVIEQLQGRLAVIHQARSCVGVGERPHGKRSLLVAAEKKKGCVQCRIPLCQTYHPPAAG
jgi:hypothetical protein